ncbi:hypothetical protein PNK_0625 [Candidatus Protochlamydia naegleriophila]|uniref:F-box domain-containing protein n=1 Tax=Candidatus Protochlamydia naegleriophila TaxID=389348 RepID=A0A0U5CNM1_9BACT|nr:F-box protein [Candidatus Protochlamydia naegleriophila]CUI16252.1 hypothetical protein PNK_0625 [Candidatus Protochlamydia naegleriophila]
MLKNLFSCFSCTSAHDHQLPPITPVNPSSKSQVIVLAKDKTISNLQILPNELLLRIFEFLATPKEFATVSVTCKDWYQILEKSSKDSSLESAVCFYLYQTLPKNILLPDVSKITRNTWHANQNQLERKEHLAFYYKISILKDVETSLKSFSVQKKSLRGEQDFPLSGNEVCIFKDKISKLSIEKVRSATYPDTEERTIGLELASDASKPEHLSFFERAAIQSVLTTLNKAMQTKIQEENQKAQLKTTKK